MSDRPDLQFVIAVCRGIVRDTTIRRRVLFYLLLGVMLLMFFGMVILGPWLNGGIMRFLLYWGACLWLTFTVFLLAIYDLLVVSRQAREEHARNKIKLLNSLEPPGPDEPPAKPEPPKSE